MSTFQLTRPLYSVKEVGQMLSYSRSTILRLIKAEKLKTIHLGVNSVRITADSLGTFLNSRGLGGQMGSQQ